MTTVVKGTGVARYIQKISLVPFSAHELWVGWELEGVEGEIPGLLSVDGLSDRDLRERGVKEFQRIPRDYVGDLRGGELVEPSPAQTRSAGGIR